MKKTELFLLLALVLVSALLSSSMLTRGHDWGGDFSSYIMQARSILNGDVGDFVEHNTFSVENSTFVIGPVAYPWGFPLFLAPAYGICRGLHPLCLKLSEVVFYALFLITYFLILKRRLSFQESFLLTALFATCWTFLSFQDYILADIPFLFFSTLALLLIDYFVMQPGDGRMAWIGPALAGMGIFLAFFVRTNGILLLPVLFGVQFIAFWRTSTEQRKHFLSLAAIPYLVFGGLALLAYLIFPGGGESYFDQLAGFSLGRSLDMLKIYFYDLPASMFERVPGQMIFYNIAFVSFVIGLVAASKKEYHFIAYYALNILLFAIWPFYQGPRFIFPILPLFIYFAYVGMKAVISLLSERGQNWGRALVYLFWGLLLISFAVTSVTSARNNLASGRDIHGPFDPVSQEMFDYIRHEIDPQSVLVFFKPRVMRMMTGLDSIAVNECSELGRGDYVVIHSKREPASGQVDPETVTDCNPNLHLEKVFTNRRFVIYKVYPVGGSE